jgi:hypothetical protein
MGETVTEVSRVARGEREQNDTAHRGARACSVPRIAREARGEREERERESERERERVS